MLALAFAPTCLHCRQLLLDDAHDNLCIRCAISHAPLPPEMAYEADITAMYPYDGPYGEIIRRLKFSHDLALAGPLGRLYSEHPRYYRDEEEQPWDAIVAVPLHPFRLWARGYNQVQLLLRWADVHATRAGKNAPPLALHVLRRSRATATQSELAAHARVGNVAGAFCVPEKFRAQIAGKRLLVCDDVTTTGATLQACIGALQHAGAAKVHGLALLRSYSEADESAPGYV